MECGAWFEKPPLVCELDGAETKSWGPIGRLVWKSVNTDVHCVPGTVVGTEVTAFIEVIL